MAEYIGFTDISLSWCNWDSRESVQMPGFGINAQPSAVTQYDVYTRQSQFSEVRKKRLQIPA